MNTTTLDILNKLNNNGELSVLISDKVVSNSVAMHMEVINEFNLSLQQTKSIMQSMEDVSETFKISVGTVRYIRAKYA